MNEEVKCSRLAIALEEKNAQNYSKHIRVLAQLVDDKAYLQVVQYGYLVRKLNQEKSEDDQVFQDVLKFCLLPLNWPPSSSSSSSSPSSDPKGDHKMMLTETTETKKGVSPFLKDVENWLKRYILFYEAQKKETKKTFDETGTQLVEQKGGFPPCTTCGGDNFCKSSKIASKDEPPIVKYRCNTEKCPKKKDWLFP
jgi:hypothetical protein